MEIPGSITVADTGLITLTRRRPTRRSPSVGRKLGENHQCSVDACASPIEYPCDIFALTARQNSAFVLAFYWIHSSLSSFSLPTVWIQFTNMTMHCCVDTFRAIINLREANWPQFIPIIGWPKNHLLPGSHPSDNGEHRVTVGH